LNFTRAAEQCNVTQPALTKAVQKLELELGGVLIHRERQLTQLTDLGKLVLPMLERAYAAAESVRTSAVEFQRKEIAPLKIAIASCVSAAIIESPLVEIARFIPGLQVELIEAETQDMVEMLLNGDVNAAIAGDDELGELPVRIDHQRLSRSASSCSCGKSPTTPSWRPCHRTSWRRPSGSNAPDARVGATCGATSSRRASSRRLDTGAVGSGICSTWFRRVSASCSGQNMRRTSRRS
jgi:DNA-binding transcriptional LysR family regulator